MKLELEHISAYLPYALKGNAFSNEGFYEPIINGELFRIETGKTLISHTYEPFLVVDDIEIEIQDFKPKLRPLSDLTKEIEVNGEKFVPIEYNAFKEDKEHLIEFQNKYAHYKSVKYGIIERLLEWHFDIFGLIEKGLAVDINTIKQ